MNTWKYYARMIKDLCQGVYLESLMLVSSETRDGSSSTRSLLSAKLPAGKKELANVLRRSSFQFVSRVSPPK